MRRLISPPLFAAALISSNAPLRECAAGYSQTLATAPTVTPVPAEISAVAAELEREGAHVDFTSGNILDKEGAILEVPREAQKEVIKSAKTTLHRLEEAFDDPAEIDAGEEAERLPAITKLFALTAAFGVLSARVG